MFDVLGVRWRQKSRTISYPKSEPVLPDRFRGRPTINRSLCSADCHSCADLPNRCHPPRFEWIIA
jgi:formate hydrogenlyase subunit 6/NADH:ubiquinone oxidoreductase subunit I